LDDNVRGSLAQADAGKPNGLPELSDIGIRQDVRAAGVIDNCVFVSAFVGSFRDEIRPLRIAFRAIILVI